MSKLIKTIALMLLTAGAAAALNLHLGTGVKLNWNQFEPNFGADTLSVPRSTVALEIFLAFNRVFSLRTDAYEAGFYTDETKYLRVNSLMSTDLFTRLPLGRFAPYLFGGVGYATPKVEPLVDFRVGIGAEYRFARKWKLFAEDELFKMVGISQEQLNGGEFVGGAHAKISAGVRFGG